MITTGHTCISPACPGLAVFGWGSSDKWACAAHQDLIWPDVVPSSGARLSQEGRVVTARDLARPSPPSTTAQMGLFA